MRLIVTGPRDWNDLVSVEWAIRAVLLNDVPPGERLTVVRGDASGVDALAGQLVRSYRLIGHLLDEEVHVARWDRCTCARSSHRVKGGRTYCPLAGPRRNAEMVAAGADQAVAFLKKCSKPRCRRPRPHWTHGTQNCIDLIVAARIPLYTIDDANLDAYGRGNS